MIRININSWDISLGVSTKHKGSAGAVVTLTKGPMEAGTAPYKVSQTKLRIRK